MASTGSKREFSELKRRPSTACGSDSTEAKRHKTNTTTSTAKPTRRGMQATSLSNFAYALTVDSRPSLKSSAKSTAKSFAKSFAKSSAKSSARSSTTSPISASLVHEDRSASETCSIASTINMWLSDTESDTSTQPLWSPPLEPDSPRVQPARAAKEVAIIDVSVDSDITISQTSFASLQNGKPSPAASPSPDKPGSSCSSPGFEVIEVEGKLTGPKG
ncbi:hypothetical protein V7S43_007457 [Phytophthora oleae]|uniref:Uncharacterized protein n=1 Tax=Phytophthora oleae TaxID=2107226 RepID=A0ABD3FMX0_9STRA